MAMAAAAICILNNRPLSRVLTRAFRAAAAHGAGGSNELARRHSSLLGSHDTISTFGIDSSSASCSSSHGVYWLALGPKAPGFSRTFASGGEPAHEKITMPALSPTMTQGNIVQWKKNEGDKVSAGDVLCEIETDKATLDLEAMEDGYLAKIIAPAGTKDIPVGQPVCITVENEDDVGKFANYSGETSTSAPAKPPPEKPETITPKEAGPPPPPASPAPDVPFQNITMPALSPTMTQGNVLQWKKHEGDKVIAGDVLCEIETDKATLDMEAMEDGYLAKILVQAGSKDIPVGQSLCVVVEEEGDVDKFKDYTGQAPAKSESTKADSGEAKSSGTSATEPPPAPAAGPKKNRVGPSVRRYLAESGLDASSVAGTGPNGMLVKGDILSAMKSGPPKQKDISAGPEPSAKRDAAPSRPSPSPSPTAAAPLSEAGPYADIPNSQIRKIIAKRLLESKTQIPHFYLSTDAIVDATLGLRKELKEKHGASISVNDFVIKAAALALRDVPEANGSWDEKSGSIKLNETIDICVAVATDKGLMTPILKDADKKSLSEISKEVKSLAEKARTGKLKPHEFQGGTFSISNLGMFAVDRFSAIINPPQACILAVGRGVKSADWSEDGGHPVAVTKMGLTLSADNRVYNGEIGGRFLEALSKNLADPKNMLL
ncbi:unnamed protein product [Calypogeia fissa]